MKPLLRYKKRITCHTLSNVSITCHTLSNVKTGEIAKSFGIHQRNFQSMRNICDSFMNCAELFVRQHKLNDQKLFVDFEQKLLSHQHHSIEYKSVGITSCKVRVSYSEENIGGNLKVEHFKKNHQSSLSHQG